MDEKIKVNFSAKYRITLGLICFAFGIIGVLTVDAAYKEVRKSVPIEKITVLLEDGKCRATSDLSVKGQIFATNEILEKKYCGRSGYPIKATEITFIRQSGAENIARIIRFVLGATLGAILFVVFLQIKPRIKSVLGRMQSTITTIDSSKIQTALENTNEEKEMPMFKNSGGNPNLQKKLIATTRMIEIFAQVLSFLGIIGGAIIMWTPSCIDDSEYGCLEKDWTTSLTYGLTAMILNFFIMGFVTMIAQYIIWRIDTESQER